MVLLLLLALLGAESACILPVKVYWQYTGGILILAESTSMFNNLNLVHSKLHYVPQTAIPYNGKPKKMKD